MYPVKLSNLRSEPKGNMGQFENFSDDNSSPVRMNQAISVKQQREIFKKRPAKKGP